MGYTPERRREIIEKAIAYRSKNYSWSEIAGKLGVGVATLRRWIRDAKSSGVPIETEADLDRIEKLQAAYAIAIDRAVSALKSSEINLEQARALKAVVDVLSLAAKGLAEVEELLAMKRARLGPIAIKEEAAKARERAVKAFGFVSEGDRDDEDGD